MAYYRLLAHPSLLLVVVHVNVADDRATASIFGQSPRAGTVLDRDYVIATLAFLCSRLLGPSKRNRAATVIQRAYRQFLLRRQRHQSWILSKLAYDCQAIVITRTKVIGASSVIQRAWRRYWARKMDDITVAVTKGKDNDVDDNERVMMLQARTPPTMIPSSVDMKASEIAEVDVWLL